MVAIFVNIFFDEKHFMDPFFIQRKSKGQFSHFPCDERTFFDSFFI